jgi:hypothetical protein
MVSPDQISEPNFELSKERIQVAFSGTATDSTKASLNGNQQIVSQFNGGFVSRGVRLSQPETAHRLIGFVTEQRWQGHVLTVGERKFSARVFDASDEEHGDEIEEVEFDIEEVPGLMRHLIVPGGIFNWDIGFQVEPSGQRIRQSILQFPMIPTFTESDRQLAVERAEMRFSSLGWDRHQHASPSESKSSSAI